jgi:hypothetical protein
MISGDLLAMPTFGILILILSLSDFVAKKGEIDIFGGCWKFYSDGMMLFFPIHMK